MPTVRTFNPNPNDMRDVRQALRSLKQQVPQSIQDATGQPTVNFDSTKGYQPGSWIQVPTASAEKVYLCVNAAEGAAVWLEFTAFPVSGGGAASPSKGDLITSNGTPTWALLPVGSDGFVLTADNAETTGLKWASKRRRVDLVSLSAAETL